MQTLVQMTFFAKMGTLMHTTLEGECGYRDFSRQAIPQYIVDNYMNKSYICHQACAPVTSIQVEGGQEWTMRCVPYLLGIGVYLNTLQGDLSTNVSNVGYRSAVPLLGD